jgi:hypothetical protein
MGSGVYRARNHAGALGHLRAPAAFNIYLRVSGFGPFEPPHPYDHSGNRGPSGVKASGLVFHTLWIWHGGWGAASGTSATLESSIFVCEGRNLDHSNRLLTARISIIDDILKALKMEFYGFLSCARERRVRGE